MSLVIKLNEKLLLNEKDQTLDNAVHAVLAPLAALGIPVGPLVVQGIQHYRKRKSREDVGQHIQTLQLQWGEVRCLDRDERLRLAKDIGWKYARKALKIGKKQENRLKLYCLEAAKEVSIVFGRSEIMEVTVDDLHRALNRLYEDLSRVRANKLTVDRVAMIQGVVQDTEELTTFYHIAMAAYGVMVVNPIFVAWNLGILAFPSTRARNAVLVLLAARLARYVYDSEYKPEDVVVVSGQS